eukprot:5636975-Prymnesium_polylepis.1
MDEWGWNVAFVDPGMGALLTEEQVPRPNLQVPSPSTLQGPCKGRGGPLTQWARLLARGRAPRGRACACHCQSRCLRAPVRQRLPLAGR